MEEVGKVKKAVETPKLLNMNIYYEKGELTRWGLPRCSC
jgi:hypothetical protein